MDRTEDDILIAIVDSADFERAKATIAGFEQWASYEDYRCEREGRLLGLAFAGQSATWHRLDRRFSRLEPVGRRFPVRFAACRCALL